MKHAEVFTKEEEQALWEKGTLGTTSPKSLLNAIFFFNGKNVCLRGGEEHRCLVLLQVVRHYNSNHYIYTKNGSKNQKGTFTDRHIPNKVVPGTSIKTSTSTHGSAQVDNSIIDCILVRKDIWFLVCDVKGVRGAD